MFDAHRLADFLSRRRGSHLWGVLAEHDDVVPTLAAAHVARDQTSAVVEPAVIGSDLDGEGALGQLVDHGAERVGVGDDCVLAGRVLAVARACGVLASLIASCVAGGIPIVPKSARAPDVLPVFVRLATIAAV